MNLNRVNVIEIIEHQSILLPRQDIPQAAVDELRQKYKAQVKIGLEDTKAGDCWKLTARGWVGYIPLMPNLGIRLQPKVPIQSILGMLEYAYDLKSFQFLDGLIDCETLEEFCDRLAAILASRILSRIRQGIYQTYVPKTGKLGYIRDRLDIRQTIQQPWTVTFTCQYQDYTADIPDNQILLWTMHCLSFSGICRQFSQHLVSEAYRGLKGAITLKHFSAQDCCDRSYNRLNQDYESLHTLCYFFLEQIVPSHAIGSSKNLPFLVDLSKLYEQFIYQWLKTHLPKTLTIQAQERFQIGKRLKFKIDLVIYEQSTGTAQYILDTKYKSSSKPSAEDVAQAIAYATAKNCQEAILIYPVDLSNPIDEWVGDDRPLHLQSLTFSTHGNLKKQGEKFLNHLFQLKHSP
jgi:5-methylcytosine-specific restriction enzyme subunit McrC